MNNSISLSLTALILADEKVFRAQLLQRAQDFKFCVGEYN